MPAILTGTPANSPSVHLDALLCDHTLVPDLHMAGQERGAKFIHALFDPFSDVDFYKGILEFTNGYAGCVSFIHRVGNFVWCRFLCANYLPSF